MKTVTELFEYSKALGWEWDEFHVYKHPREPKKYVVDIQAGCSCDYYNVPSLAELEAETPVGKREVYAAFSTWWNNDDCQGTKIDILQSLRDSL